MTQAIKDYDAEMDQKYEETIGKNGGQLETLGAKPNKDDTNFEVNPIPDTRLAIRIWDGGMESYTQYFIDFFRLDKWIPVNAFDGYELHCVSTPGMMPMAAGRHHSSENTFGISSTEIKPGEEKFCLPEGSRWCLKTRRGA
ncbi:hypothetical protein F5I97DRAFT_1842083 [Phlebopus sp. FC_14]|nr:hypothetical protein F5I97DRAFT_1842083 [Phlebopus sp. FC_14]